MPAAVYLPRTRALCLCGLQSHLLLGAAIPGGWGCPTIPCSTLLLYHHRLSTICLLLNRLRAYVSTTYECTCERAIEWDAWVSEHMSDGVSELRL